MAPFAVLCSEKSCELERKGAAKALQRRRGLLVWWIRRQAPMLMDRCRLRKRSAVVVQSSVVPFVVLCGERRCAVERKGNAVKRQTSMKSSVHLVFSFVNNSLCWWTIAKMASRETCSICSVTLGTTSEKCRPCDPRHRRSTVPPYARGRTIVACCRLRCTAQLLRCVT